MVNRIRISLGTLSTTALVAVAAANIAPVVSERRSEATPIFAVPLQTATPPTSAPAPGPSTTPPVKKVVLPPPSPPQGGSAPPPTAPTAPQN